jgi:hypothetical protein
MKSKSVILLIVLIVTLAFILGFRLGQKVEKTNKVVNYILSITPTKVPPTPTPPSYNVYKSKKWGLKFTYPSNLEVKESSKTAEILFKLK